MTWFDKLKDIIKIDIKDVINININIVNNPDPNVNHTLSADKLTINATKVEADRKKKELFMATNLYNAWIFLEKNCHRHPTHHDMHELHKRVNRDVETEETLGRYKTVQNYIGDVYTTAYMYTQEKMHKLLRWIRSAYKNINDFEVAFQSPPQKVCTSSDTIRKKK